MNERATATQRGYDAKWQRTRRRYLRTHEFCECDVCAKLPITKRPLAEVVHHLDGKGPLGPQGHDPANLQALTKQHHDRITGQTQGGFSKWEPRSRKPEQHPGLLG